LWFVAASATATPGMIAIVSTLLISQVIMSGVMPQVILSTVFFTIWGGILAEGEMSALSWLPMILVVVWIQNNGPTPLPPERIAYVPRRHQLPTWFEQLVQATPVSWQQRVSVTHANGDQSLLWSKREDHRSCFQYSAYSPTKSHSTSQAINRKLAI
jgi:hypothetical protein